VARLCLVSPVPFIPIICSFSAGSCMKSLLGQDMSTRVDDSCIYLLTITMSSLVIII
jgi:hypothetical protein